MNLTTLRRKASGKEITGKWLSRLVKYSDRKRASASASVAFLLALLLVLPFGAYAQENAVELVAPIDDLGYIFTDVKFGTSHYEAIRFLKETGIIQGNPDGSYHPYEEVNRAEAVALALRAMEVQTNETPLIGNKEISPSPFTDIAPGDWFYETALLGAEKGIVKGYPDGTFQPGKTINRAEALVIVFRALGIEPAADTEPLPEWVSDVSPEFWYAGHAAYALQYFIINPTDSGMFEPAASLWRGQFAELLYRTMLLQNAQRSATEPPQFGRASWYGDGLSKIIIDGKEAFHEAAHTAAHKTYPLGTIVQVKNLDNGKTVEVLINDRGPFVHGRIIDLSRSSFDAIGDSLDGIMRHVEVIPLSYPENAK